ncbi:bifunctional 2-polyprenyl-6-hydroxyphenol methylase/3-demethylubiquinol 3-O-methyltransferase UbiG [Paenibacillus sp. 32O-W]|uniref:class I SAM-dependent methyltransferase n=1 Tax=Paenibacillus sp. 32O-W TaxID=1695218 RepID=UPI0011A1CCAE|nr:class I SAM-dependent methyltransferase [Paenibacillus sp. 32O-W]
MVSIISTDSTFPDTIGQILNRCLSGEEGKIIIERDDNFKSYSNMDSWLSQNPVINEFEIELLDNTIGPRVLDIGCGTGRHVRFLSSRGLDAHGIDISQGVIDIGKKLGTKNIKHGSLWDFPERDKFDTIVFMDGSLGMIGRISRLSEMFEKINKILSINGQIVIMGIDWRDSNNPIHIKYNQKNHEANKYGGEIKIRLRFNDIVGEWFEWVWVDPDTLMQLAIASGYKIKWFKQIGNKFGVILQLKENRLVNRGEDEWIIGKINYPIRNQAEISFGNSYKGMRTEQIGPYIVAFPVQDSYEKKLSLSIVTDICKFISERIDLPVFVGGSHSPLSCNKHPFEYSDLDLYICVRDFNVHNSELKNKILTISSEICNRFNFKHEISIGVIKKEWLKMPYFCECLNPLDAFERKWWNSLPEEREQEAERRINNALNYMRNLSLDEITNQIQSLIGKKLAREQIGRVILTPRWKSITEFKLNRIRTLIEEQ